MKILIDMNLSPDWVQALTAAGHDADTSGHRKLVGACRPQTV
jgi:predicted nuclease of predicted toxin-antitoxin system